MFKIALNALEMYQLQDMLPPRAKAAEAILVAHMREKLALTAEDRREVGMGILPGPAGLGGQVLSCQDKDRTWEVEFDDSEMDHLVAYARDYEWPTTAVTEPLLHKLEDASGRNIIVTKGARS